MRLILIILSFILANSAIACDLSQPDKIKHIKYSRRATQITRNTVSVVFIPIKPIKWIFNDKIQLIFPDNYIPGLVAGTLVLSAGILKEIPYDLLTPGDLSFCDIVADYHGIKEGIKD